MASKGRIAAEKVAREMTKQLQEGIALTGVANGHVLVDEEWLKETRGWAWQITLTAWDEEATQKIVQAIIRAVEELDPRATAPVEAK